MSSHSPAPRRPIRALVSALIERAGLAQYFGQTYGGKRRVFDACGYQEKLEPADYWWRYERNEIAGRVIDTMPKATWRGGGALVEDQDPEVTTRFEQEWQELDQRLKIWPTFERADRLAGLGEYAVILIGGPGKFDEPLLRATGQQIIFLQPYSQRNAKVEGYITNNQDPRFGEPEFYSLNIQASPTASQWTRVHHTRVLHIVDDKLESNIKARPKLQRLWNRLDDLEKVVGSGSEAFYQRVHGVKQVEMDPELEWTSEDEEAVTEKVDEAVHGLRRWFGTKGVEIKDFGSQVAMFDKNVDSLLMLISAGSEIPFRILSGSERGELASSQDKNNWNERVKDRRLAFAGPGVVRPFADRMILIGALSKPKEYVVEFPDEQDRTIEESMAVAKDMAKTNKDNGEMVFLSDEIRKAAQFAPLEEVDPEAAARRDEPERDDARGEDDEDDEDVDIESRAAAAQPAPWRAIHRAADANREHLRRAFLTAFVDGRATVAVMDLETAFRDRNEHDVERLLMGAAAHVEESLTADVPDRLLDALIAGGRAGARVFSVSSEAASRQAADIDLSFDTKNPKAEEWARTHSADLVRQVTAETREAIRMVIARAFSEGIPPRDAARLLRSIVGLSAKDAQAVVNAQFKLAEASAGSLVKVGVVRVRIPERGLKANEIRRLVSQYADRLLRQRALTIARTETLRASNMGQQQLWQQAIDKGLLTGSERRAWIVTPDERLCPRCNAMDGQERALSELFVDPSTGSTVLTPPLHPRCRCAIGIVAGAKREALHAAA